MKVIHVSAKGLTDEEIKEEVESYLKHRDERIKKHGRKKQTPEEIQKLLSQQEKGDS